MVQKRSDNFLEYNMAQRYWFVEAMIQIHESSACIHCGEHVHKITKERAYGPEYEPDMDTGIMQIRFICYECRATGDYIMSFKDKRVIPTVLSIYQKERPESIHKLLVFNIWERIYWKTRRFLKLEVPSYAL